MRKQPVMLVLSLVLMFAFAAQAGFKDDITKLVGDNATSYVHPITNGVGVGMNSGWYNSSKSYSFFKVPVGLQVYYGSSFATVDAGLKKYNFHGAIEKQSLVNLGMIPAPVANIIPGDSFIISKPGAPTAVGDKNPMSITLRDLLLANGASAADLALVPAANQAKEVLQVPGGMNLPTVPFPMIVGLNLGLPYKIQLGLRLMPAVSIPGSDIGEVSQLGIKAQYEFTEWIPVVSTLPLLHTSVMYAFNSANFFDMLKLNNWTTMLNVSGDLKFLMGLGFYGGIGFEGSTMNLDYTVPATVPSLGGTKVSLKDTGDNSFKALVGIRFSFAIFDIMADATFAKTNSYFVGVGLGFNNL
jgi:hypothetical protein